MGSGSDKRARAAAVRVAKLKRDGLTYRQIADLIGIKPEQVASRAALGERLLSLVADTPMKGGAA